MSIFDSLYSEEKLKQKAESIESDIADLDDESKELAAQVAASEASLKFEPVPHSERRKSITAIEATMKQIEQILAKKKRKEERLRMIRDRLGGGS